MNESTLYWLWLKLLRPFYDRKAYRLIKDFGSPEKVFHADERVIRARADLTPEEIEALLLKDLSLARAEMAACEALGIEILTMHDPRYPVELRALYDPPLLFYAKGDLSLLSIYPKLTVVGTRRASSEGVSITLKLAKELASGGAVIVSGMADGIDGAAHAGALRARGKTIALLGCGIDIPYPASNLALKEEIGEKGLLLSEFSLGTAAIRTNFPYRNRVLSALSDGTLVVEAGQRSGALITARNAVEQGKSVYALPWNVEHIAGIGGNELLRDGGAQMVLSGMEIMRDLLKLPHEELKKAAPDRQAMRAAEPKPRKRIEISSKPESAPPRRDLSPKEAAVLSVLSKTDSFDDICKQSGIPVSELNGLLIIMEIKGLIVKKSGKRYYKKQE